MAAADNGVTQGQRSAGTGGQHHSLCQGKSQADAGGPLAGLGDSALGRGPGYKVSSGGRRHSGLLAERLSSPGPEGPRGANPRAGRGLNRWWPFRWARVCDGPRLQARPTASHFVTANTSEAASVITASSQLSHTSTHTQKTESAGTGGPHLPTSFHQPRSCWTGFGSAALSRGRGVQSGVRLLTVAIVQEVSDEAGTAGGPGLLGVHVSHHRGHDMVGGAPRPIQIHTWLRIVMQHVEDVACESGGHAGVPGSQPVVRSVPTLLQPTSRAARAAQCAAAVAVHPPGHSGPFPARHSQATRPVLTLGTASSSTVPSPQHTSGARQAPRPPASFNRQIKGLSTPSAEEGDSQGPRPGRRRRAPCPRLHLVSSRFPRRGPDPSRPPASPSS